MDVLMAFRFKLPHDFYFWGQDRGGSLVPLIAHILFMIFHLSPLWSVSLTHYFILIAGYFSLSSFLKKNFTKIILAAFLFLPGYGFIDLLWYFIGTQLCLVGVLLFLFKKTEESTGKTYAVNGYLFSAVIISLLAIWVSDISAASVLLAVLFFLFRNRRNKNVLKITTAYFLPALVLIPATIVLMKSTAMARAENYSSINSPEIAWKGIGIVLDTISGILSFSTYNVFVTASVYATILLGIFFLFVRLRRMVQFSETKYDWVYFFILNAVMIFAMVLFSRWAYLNDLGRRYFISVYADIVMITLLFAERIQNFKMERVAFILILFIALCGPVSTIYHYKYIDPRKLESSTSEAMKFDQLGPCGLIGDYWSAYLCGMSRPDLVISTPHEGNWDRNPELSREAVNQPAVYLMSYDWLDSFPDSVIQFRKLLLKDGEEFLIGNRHICKYRPEKIN